MTKAVERGGKASPPVLLVHKDRAMVVGGEPEEP